MRILGRNLLIVGVVVAVVVVASNLLRDHNPREALDARIATIRAADEPTSLAELAGDPVPPDQNAATLLREAERAEGDAYLDLLRRAARRPVWRVDPDWAEGPSVLNAEAQWLERAAAFLRERVRADPTFAAEAFLVHVSLAELYGGPLLPGYNVALKHRGVALEFLKIAATRPGFDARRCRALVDERLANTLPPTGPPAQPFIQQRAFVLWAVDTWEQGRRTRQYKAREDRRRASWLGRHRIYDDAEQALNLLDRAIEESGTAPEQAALVPALFDRSLRRGRRLLAREMQYSTRKAYRRYVKTVARLRLARVALAALEYRQIHDVWPAPELLPAIVDPATGEPFEYTYGNDGAQLVCKFAEESWDLE